MFVNSASRNLQQSAAYHFDDKISVLRSAGIYGANASGKSNWLLALKALKTIICDSGFFKDGDPIPSEPFFLSEQTIKSPTIFEIEFIVSSVRFKYKVSHNRDRILEESLDYYPNKVKANLFTRNDSDTWETLKYGSHLKGGKRKFAFFDNNTYISKAGNSADAPVLIRSVFNYFNNKIYSAGVNINFRFLGWKDDPVAFKQVGGIISKVDAGVSNLELEEDNDLVLDLPDHFPNHLKERIINDRKKKVVFLHEAEDGELVPFPEELESAGTLKLFEFLPLLIKSFIEGGVLLFDEIDCSFHPHLAEMIIKLFNSEKVNKNNAQLIFTTHDISLMKPENLRRDQIWFTEKNKGETTLTCLDEFDKSVVKANSPFGRWYDEARFGAVPAIDFDQIAKILAGE